MSRWRLVAGLGATALLALASLVAVVGSGWFAGPESGTAHGRIPPPDAPSGPAPSGDQQATFGAGCFWCAEAVFQRLKGVRSVVPGYTFDPAEISFGDLLEVFWQTHDPTTPNRQGHDVGPQYRSVILYHDEEQRTQAEHYKEKLDASGAFAAPLVTEIVPFTGFTPAEAYHENYFANHPRQPYCSAVIGPKVKEFERVFKDKLKSPRQEPHGP
jgi:peptide-methionine (S)-S-oxide reductase